MKQQTVQLVIEYDDEGIYPPSTWITEAVFENGAKVVAMVSEAPTAVPPLILKDAAS